MIILCNFFSLPMIIHAAPEEYVELVLSKAAATRILGDVLSLRHPMKTLAALLYGSFSFSP